MSRSYTRYQSRLSPTNELLDLSALDRGHLLLSLLTLVLTLVPRRGDDSGSRERLGGSKFDLPTGLVDGSADVRDR